MDTMEVEVIIPQAASTNPDAGHHGAMTKVAMVVMTMAMGRVLLLDRAMSLGLHPGA
jgi:hypothetical protein